MVMHSHDILKVSCHTHMEKVIIRMVIMMIGAKKETSAVYITLGFFNNSTLDYKTIMSHDIHPTKN